MLTTSEKGGDGFMCMMCFVLYLATVGTFQPVADVDTEPLQTHTAIHGTGLLVVTALDAQ